MKIIYKKNIIFQQPNTDAFKVILKENPQSFTFIVMLV